MKGSALRQMKIEHDKRSPQNMPPASTLNAADTTRGTATKPSWKRRAIIIGLMTLYCVAIYATLDFIYTKYFQEKDRFGRIAHDYYHHGLMANFEGFESWGRLRARIYTNNLGFKDVRIRHVPAVADTRRILLIGDSVTEGIGLKFEDTFAGMLYLAGQQRSEKIEFLNAAAVSYSPIIYYKRIKYLLEAGLHFDEVVVFSDLSDVQDEATAYFCIDDRPEFRQYCTEPLPAGIAPPTLTPMPSITPPLKTSPKFMDTFAITHRLLQLFWYEFDLLTGSSRRFVERTHVTQRSGWTIGGAEFDKYYAPLGVEGGIRRSLMNMEALAEQLRLHGIGLTVVVYPWPFQLIHGDRHSRQVEIWRDFCAKHCNRFIDLFPAVFAEKDTRSDWYEYIFIPGDFHYSAAGNRILFRELAKHLL